MSEVFLSGGVIQMQLPERLSEQLGKLKVGKNLKIKGTFQVKEITENNVLLELTNLFVERKSRYV